MKVRERGAALLAALLTVALVATLAAGGLWQQWRTIEVEQAERSRMQAGWILVGALDWGRLILAEDARSGSVDHLGEPWALPLQESRLSTFLAADRQASTDADGLEAFLSGSITDLQGRLNVNNLVEAGKPWEPGVRSFQRLFEALGLPATELELLLAHLLRAQGAGEATPSPLAPLPPQRVADLAWLGLSPATRAVLGPHVTVLPGRTTVNLNTASAPVIFAALPGIGLAEAQRLVTARQSAPFQRVGDAMRLLGEVTPPESGVGVGSRFFEVRGRLRLDGLAVEERSLVERENRTVRTLWRERGAMALPAPR